MHRIGRVFVAVLRSTYIHTYIHIYIYIYIYVCVCVCVRARARVLIFLLGNLLVVVLRSIDKMQPKQCAVS